MFATNFSQGIWAMSNSHSDQSADHKKQFLIIVNGRQREVSQHQLTYLDVVQLAFPGEVPTSGAVYTVTFSTPHGKEGSMVEGQEETVKEGMIFNVSKTTQS
jgi:hypothetical protein